MTKANAGPMRARRLAALAAGALTLTGLISLSASAASAAPLGSGDYLWVAGTTTSLQERLPAGGLHETAAWSDSPGGAPWLDEGTQQVYVPNIPDSVNTYAAAIYDRTDDSQAGTLAPPPGYTGGYSQVVTSATQVFLVRTVTVEIKGVENSAVDVYTKSTGAYAGQLLVAGADAIDSISPPHPTAPMLVISYHPGSQPSDVTATLNTETGALTTISQTALGPGSVWSADGRYLYAAAGGLAVYDSQAGADAFHGTIAEYGLGGTWVASGLTPSADLSRLYIAANDPDNDAGSVFVVDAAQTIATSALVAAGASIPTPQFLPDGVPTLTQDGSLFIPAISLRPDDNEFVLIQVANDGTVSLAINDSVFGVVEAVVPLAAEPDHFAVFGGGQSAPTGQQFAKPVGATVESADGTPIEGVYVDLFIVIDASTGDATFAGGTIDAVGKTDSSGTFQTTVMAGQTAGEVTIWATVRPLGTQTIALDVTPTVNPGPTGPYTFTQNDVTPVLQADKTFSPAVSLRVTDQAGDPVSGVAIDFVIESGRDDEVVFTANGSPRITVTTGADGVASPAMKQIPGDWDQDLGTVTWTYNVRTTGDGWTFLYGSEDAPGPGPQPSPLPSVTPAPSPSPSPVAAPRSDGLATTGGVAPGTTLAVASGLLIAGAVLLGRGARGRRSSARRRP